MPDKYDIKKYDFKAFSYIYQMINDMNNKADSLYKKSKEILFGDDLHSEFCDDIYEYPEVNGCRLTCKDQ